MIRVYFAVAIVAAIFLAYVTGVHVGNVRMRAQFTGANAEQLVIITKIMDKANEMSIHTGVGDIRRVLYEKYTIAE